MFTRADYDTLHSLVFQDGYPGYRKEVREVPNGDGKVDADKRYAHVATKYLMQMNASSAHRTMLLGYRDRAHDLAMSVAEALGVPEPFMPDRHECALRVLEYPAGVGGHVHTDFDLFTLSLYRSQPEKLVLHQEQFTPDEHDCMDARLAARALNPGLHIGELGELIGLGEATKHHVEPSDQTQHSIVYFALPSPDAAIYMRDADGQAYAQRTAGEWLAERYARSRVAS